MNRRNWLSSAAILGASSFIPHSVLAQPQIDENTIEEQSAIYLRANENPYGPSRKALVAMQEQLAKGNRYPGHLRRDFVKGIAQKYDVTSDHVVLGAGSTEILQLIANWCLYQKLPVISGAITFTVLPKFVQKFGGEAYLAEMTSGKGFDLDAIGDMARKNPGLIYLVNPNNPTGTKLDKSDIEAFCSLHSKDSYIVIDEAYIEYLDEKESCVNLIANNPKIIIVRTFSKIYGLAGMRVGYCLAHPDTAELIRMHQSWAGVNLNNVGLAAAMASLEDVEFAERTKASNEQVRAYVQEELRKMGLLTIDSCTNFVFYRCGRTDIDISRHFTSNNVWVRTMKVETEEWMRVSIGTQKEMERFIEIAKQLWSK